MAYPAGSNGIVYESDRISAVNGGKSYIPHKMIINYRLDQGISPDIPNIFVRGIKYDGEIIDITSQWNQLYQRDDTEQSIITDSIMLEKYEVLSFWYYIDNFENMLELKSISIEYNEAVDIPFRKKGSISDPGEGGDEEIPEFFWSWTKASPIEQPVKVDYDTLEEI